MFFMYVSPDEDEIWSNQLMFCILLKLSIGQLTAERANLQSVQRGPATRCICK